MAILLSFRVFVLIQLILIPLSKHIWAQMHNLVELQDPAGVGIFPETETDEVLARTVPMNEAPISAQPESLQQTDSLKNPLQSGPFIDILGHSLLSLEIVNETRAELQPHLTNHALSGKHVVGLYFSADWCGPCRKFTPELVAFYQKMNRRRGKIDRFEIVWISRCRDVDAFGKYFTQMGGWYALPPEEAMGERGAKLGEKYKVKGIPSLVLLDEAGNVITTDARNKIPQDKAGIGFPWRNPLSTLYLNILPKSLRLLIRTHIFLAKDSLIRKLKTIFRFPKKQK